MLLEEADEMKRRKDNSFSTRQAHRMASMQVSYGLFHWYGLFTASDSA